MNTQLSIDQATQQATARLWFNAWRRSSHDMKQPPIRSRLGGNPIGQGSKNSSKNTSKQATAFSQWRDIDVRVLSGAALLAVLVIGLAAGFLMPANCQSRPVPFVAGLAFSVAISVPAGRACSVAVNIGSVAVKSFKIDAPPAHGELVPRGRTGVVYIPQPSFKGEDAFAFSIEGGSELGSGKS